MIGFPFTVRHFIPVSTSSRTIFNSAIVVAIASFAILAISSPPQQAFAAVVTWDGNNDGDGDNSSWSDPENWDGDTMPTGADFIDIGVGNPIDFVVHLDTDFTLTTGQIIIADGDELVVDPTFELSITNTNPDPPGAILIVGTGTDSGTLTNSGTLIINQNSGVGITVGLDAELVNSGTINIGNTGSGTGISINSGTFTNTGTGTITLNNIGSNDAINVFANGTIVNSGTITVSNSGGTFGIVISSNSSLTNSETMTVSNSGDFSTGIIILTTGTLTNSASGTMTVSNIGNNGVHNFDGTLDNSGIIIVSNSGDSSLGIENAGNANITNSGTLTVNNTAGIGIGNFASATINNGGSIIEIGAGASLFNHGLVANANTGIINVYGNFSNLLGAEVDNGGEITIFSGGEVDNTAGAINNDGTITEKCGGIYSGTAPVGNLVIVESCDSTAPIVTVPANITVAATSAAGAVVSYVASASDSGGLASFGCTPSPGSTFPIGNTTVTCTATDLAGLETSESFTITVTPPNSLPVANDDSYQTLAGNSVNGNIMDNDTDADNDPLQASITQPPSSGVVILNVNTGNFTYTPNAGFSGTDAFKYNLNDGTDDSNEATVTITVGRQTVQIDIKPGDSKNTLSIKNDKSVRVAILSTASFDATTVKTSPLSNAPKFGGTTPQAPIAVSIEDVNGDGRLDIVLKFNSGKLGFVSGNNTGCLTGNLTNGTPIEGCGSIRLVR